MTSMEFRDLKRQYAALKDDIDRALTGTAALGTYIGGEPVAQLEDELAQWVGVRHCVTCANGTDALFIALKVWNVGPGDAVFVPDFTFFSTAEVVAALGATPVFVDVDAMTFNIDVQDLERKIAAVEAQGLLRPAVVTAVDLFGQPANFRRLEQVISGHGLMLLEDGAQGFGGSMDGWRACRFGGIATTSFFPAKPLGCYGDGGAIFTDNNAWANLARSLKVHGKGSCKYDNVRIGLNSRLDTIQAAVLAVKFKAFKEYELDAVNQAAAKYTELFENFNLPVITPVVPEGFYSSWAQYTIRLASLEERDALQAWLKEQHIPSMVYYPRGMHIETAFSDCPSFGPCPVSENLCDTVLSLPMHPYLTDVEIEAVAGAVRDFFAHRS